MSVGSGRSRYGVKLEGCSGMEIVWCRTRADADRVRRVVRAYTGFTGARTLEALANHALRSRGQSTVGILSQFGATDKKSRSITQ